ncbi:tripartite tricarboxylate transporter permease [Nesterenkonia muleiensis]|uniref:tripartite tricarboxylate transporter permease n=1 Tax=Nesterenkonia muleiensis TaxID=2282648 RepID=UPI000E757004|nr:tripartite tricarboxylate transporter permease [Nesterenkonia muleiensis]
MDTFSLLTDGILAAIHPTLLLAALFAAFAGTLVGALPGLGPVAGAAIILPITFTLDPAIGLIMIIGIYLGAQYGGSTASILLNIPGESSSIVSTFDGHPMSKNGRAGAALAISAMGSFFATIVAIIIFVLTASWIAGVALNFGAVDYFALTAGGLLVLSRITGGSLAKGLLPMCIGLGLGTVGLDTSSGLNRFTFGHMDLSLGVGLASVAIGLYGISEMMRMLEGENRYRRPPPVPLRELVPNKNELRRSFFPWWRGSFVGFIFGLLPVPSATLSTFTSYRIEKSISKNKSQFGKGAVEGLAGPEAANNGAAIGSLVPVLLLGLPFSAVLAFLLSAMMVHGIQPGPLVMTSEPDLFWSIIGGVIVTNVILLILNLPMIGVWVQVLRAPQWLLIPVMIVLGVIGVYSINSNMIDLWIMLVLGIVGYFLRKYDFSLASLLVGLVLGPLIERYFIRSMQLGQGDISYLVSSPLALSIWSLVAVTLVGPPLLSMLSKKRSKSSARQ